MARITEIAPDVFQLTTFIPEANLQFHQFLVRDEEPLLFHTGMRSLFPLVREAVDSILPAESLRWISFSHFEADECGSLTQWQTIAPNATAACSFVAKVVSVDDMAATRPARALGDNEVFSTGRYRFRFLQTPQVPHCWEAGLLYEEVNGTLFCSDLFHQNGEMEPLTESDIVERFRKTLTEYQNSPLANYIPYTPNTDGTIKRLASLQPKTLAPMHGSAYSGNCSGALDDLAVVLKDVLGPENN